MKNIRLFTSEERLFAREDKCICSCINVHVFTSEESLFTGKRIKYINVRVYISEESLFTFEDKCILRYVYLLVKEIYSRAKINVYANV